MNLGSESIWVALQDSFHSRLTCALILHVVAAVDTIAAITVTTRGKTLTIPAHGHMIGVHGLLLHHADHVIDACLVWL